MIIHLIGSMREFDKDLPIMDKIAQTIENSNGSISLNWVAGVHDRKTRGSQTEQSLDWTEIVEENVAAITHADILIVEGSHFNYSQGYQTAIALQYNKPVLNLYREDSLEYKNWPDKFFVSGISHPLFTNKTYKDKKDIEKIVRKFLKDHTKRTHDLDVKITLDNEVYMKIDKLSHKSGKSKAGVIKDIISQNNCLYLDKNT
jgi:hypothetical protein